MKVVLLITLFIASCAPSSADGTHLKKYEPENFSISQKQVDAFLYWAELDTLERLEPVCNSEQYPSDLMFVVARSRGPDWTIREDSLNSFRRVTDLLSCSEVLLADQQGFASVKLLGFCDKVPVIRLYDYNKWHCDRLEHKLNALTLQK